jgi:enoyl-CoA hydratase/carnithine racemase
VSEPTILYAVDGAVARLTLNRPRRINALNLAMRDDLFEALTAFADDPAVKVAVIRGAGGKGFCAGADLIEFGTAPSQDVARRTRQRRDVWGLLAGLRKPIVAALHGYVIGAGVEIAGLCDIRVAAEDAVFALPEVTIGMIPGAGGTQTFPRTAGLGTAMARLLAERTDRMTAAEALSSGFVHRVVPRSELQRNADEIAAALVRREAPVLKALKIAVLDGLDVPMEAGLGLERRLAVST